MWQDGCLTLYDQQLSQPGHAWFANSRLRKAQDDGGLLGKDWAMTSFTAHSSYRLVSAKIFASKCAGGGDRLRAICSELPNASLCARR